MATYRIGISSEFSLDAGVGIGTATPGNGLGDLRVDGTYKTEDLDVLGVSTLSRYAGFAADKINIDTSRDVTLTGEHSTLGDIVVGVNSTFTVSAGATVDVGTVPSVSIGTHFSPPTAGVEDRPEAPVEGTVRFNRDLNTLEFYNGVEWRQFTVNGASGRGYFGPSPSPAGGQVPNATMHSLSVVNYSGLTEWGNLTAGGYAQNSACSSATRIIFGGGTPYANPWPVIDSMDYKAMASDGNTQDFGDLTDARRAITAFSSSTRGIFVGGVEPASVNVIDYVEIATTGDALDFGDCMTAGRYSQSGCASPTRGLCVHGNPNNRDYIEVLSIASKGSTIKFGNRLFQGGYTTGVCNGVRALFGGGYQMNPLTGPSRSEITTVIMASDGNETHFGDLTAGRYYAIGLSSQTRAVFLGGTTNSKVVDSVLYESGGTAVNLGELDRARWSTNGSTDCHGGLGGY